MSEEQANGSSQRRRWSILNIVLGGLAGLVILAIVGAIGFAVMLYHYGSQLPDYQQLADYHPPVVTRIQAGDGSLVEEYARQTRLFVPIDEIPEEVVEAFLAAEDKTFFSHGGLDYMGIARAAFTNVINSFTGRRPVGASTITQQVAKNFLLTNEVSYERKIKEAILAYRIERAFTKDQILELYLNEIYLGVGAYGVAAASLKYFDKSLDEMTLAEMAYLAALPKAPNNYHPVRRHDAAIGRRNWVLERMREEDFISAEELAAAREEPLVPQDASRPNVFQAKYFAEEVRRILYKQYGEKGVYEAGLSVRTTLDPRLQGIAERVMRAGLVAYDRRHGWRGVVDTLSAEDMAGEWAEALREKRLSFGVPGWKAAVVLGVAGDAARIGFADGTEGRIPFEEMKWARLEVSPEELGPDVESATQLLHRGDIIATELVKTKEGTTHYTLRQVPAVSGGLVALDPHTGRVLAMVGGFNHKGDVGGSEFNRATQALRQPGSSFKPFVYMAGLDNGFTPSSQVLDAPFVIDQGAGLGLWKPANYSEDFYGPSTLRTGIEKSRNLMTVRLAQYVGMDKVADYAKRFNIDPKLQPTLSMSLGAGETTLMRMTAAYGMIVNGGKKIEPTFIDRIQDRYGKTIFRQDNRACEGCSNVTWNGQTAPVIADEREQVIRPQTAYQMVSMLEGVVQRGTGRTVAQVGKPLAGKTGTTNDYFDAWFVGFSPDLAVGIYIGFDQPRTLGRRETGSVAAAPIFRDFMTAALKNQPGIPFRIPSGLRLVQVNAKTGLPTYMGDPSAILEAFLPGTEPSSTQTVLDGSSGGGADSTADDKLKVGTGGLY